jgi:hypothetical protein
MEAIRTLYRFIVMVATVAIVVMGWRLYGPSASQCKELAARGVELAQTWLSGAPTSNDAAKETPRLRPMEPTRTATGSRQSAPPLLAGATVPPTGGPAALPASAPDLADISPSRLESTNGAAINPSSATATSSATERGDRLTQLFAQLSELGVQAQQLSPWGKSGQLYRFSCRANLKQGADFTRHFESVATSPSEAVEEVLAQVSAWRNTPLAAR